MLEEPTAVLGSAGTLTRLFLFHSKSLRTGTSALRFMESPVSPKRLGAHWNQEPARAGKRRDSVLECGSLLPLSYLPRNRRLNTSPSIW